LQFTKNLRLKNIKIATAQFENKSGDKNYNLSVIEKLAGNAAVAGADIIAFHECSATGYTFARHLSKEQLLDGLEQLLTQKFPGFNYVFADKELDGSGTLNTTAAGYRYLIQIGFNF